MEYLSNYIGGKMQKAASGEYLDVIDPSVGQVYAQAPDSGEEDINAAVKAASEAFEAWSESSAEYRSEILLKIAALIDKKHEELSRAESKDNGKPLWLARQVDIPRASANFRFFAKAITQ